MVTKRQTSAIFCGGRANQCGVPGNRRAQSRASLFLGIGRLPKFRLSMLNPGKVCLGFFMNSLKVPGITAKVPGKSGKYAQAAENIFRESAVLCHQQGDYSQDIFKDREDYKMFLELLKKYKGQYGFKLFAFCLLPNHFHLLMELPKQGQGEDKAGILSAVMHDLNSSYTKYFNGRYQQKGHLFRERYKAALIEKEPYLLKVSAYIHLNPQALNLSVDPGAYPYSSYMFYLDKTISEGDFLAEEKQELLGLLNGQDYGAFIEKVSKEPLFAGLHNSLRKGVLGTSDFEEKVRRMLLPAKDDHKARGLKYRDETGGYGFYRLIYRRGDCLCLKNRTGRERENFFARGFFLQAPQPGKRIVKGFGESGVADKPDLSPRRQGA